jgi:hypothetical protein
VPTYQTRAARIRKRDRRCWAFCRGRATRAQSGSWRRRCSTATPKGGCGSRDVTFSLSNPNYSTVWVPVPRKNSHPTTLVTNNNPNQFFYYNFFFKTMAVLAARPSAPRRCCSSAAPRGSGARGTALPSSSSGSRPRRRSSLQRRRATARSARARRGTSSFIHRGGVVIFIIFGCVFCFYNGIDLVRLDC